MEGDATKASTSMIFQFEIHAMLCQHYFVRIIKPLSLLNLYSALDGELGSNSKDHSQRGVWTFGSVPTNCTLSTRWKDALR